MYEKQNFIHKLKFLFNMVCTTSVVPRGIRNNNPLNIRYSPNNNWKGRITENKQDDSFEEFTEIAYGVRAACRLIQVYVIRYHCSTIRSIVYRFAPPSENDTLSYYKYVRDAVGNLAVKVDDPRFMARLIGAMWFVENGEYPTHEDWEQINLGVLLYISDYVHELV